MPNASQDLREWEHPETHRGKDRAEEMTERRERQPRANTA